MIQIITTLGLLGYPIEDYKNAVIFLEYHLISTGETI